MPLHMRVIEGGSLVFDTDSMRVTAFSVQHRGPDNLGYLFEEKGRRPFLPEKAEALDIPPGPWRRELVEGKAVTLPDGRTIDPDSVLGEFRPGLRLAVVGDVADTASLVPVLRGVDALVIEGTYLEEEADMARQFGHLTVRRASELAREAGISQLFLTHVSRRYREKDIIQETEAVFPGAVVARDFDTYTIKKD
jgi:ribonuclease Z